MIKSIFVVNKNDLKFVNILDLNDSVNNFEHFIKLIRENGEEEFLIKVKNFLFNKKEQLVGKIEHKDVQTVDDFVFKGQNVILDSSVLEKSEIEIVTNRTIKSLKFRKIRDEVIIVDYGQVLKSIDIIDKIIKINEQQRLWE